MVDITSDTILGIIAIIISIVSLWVARSFNKKALKQAEKSLEQSKKNTIAQITYEGRKKVYSELRKILDKNKKYFELKREIENFMKTPEAILLSGEMVSTIYKELGKLEEYAKKDPDEPPEPSDEQIDKQIEESIQVEQSYYENLTPRERFKEEFKKEIETSKVNIMGVISRELNFPISFEKIKGTKKKIK